MELPIADGDARQIAGRGLVERVERGDQLRPVLFIGGHRGPRGSFGFQLQAQAVDIFRLGSG